MLSMHTHPIGYQNAVKPFQKVHPKVHSIHIVSAPQRCTSLSTPFPSIPCSYSPQNYPKTFADHHWSPVHGRYFRSCRLEMATQGQPGEKIAHSP